ncbi:ATP-grasp domain-containing protein [Marinobacter sp. M216]|uniref:ATP-grasp domain-containing protein n=1 Tax=Marinobacter albus TaxID=3030833 RepID=A0ABT7HBD9_9GAMM|nr:MULTISPECIES: ATP-grasp domain-containing protein [unclassified Marinobacter]MBW7470066.1 ATP-grasp domain-containing protein [Marinobacter sp. F4218]MDK9557670.1 ATP-grasp domain-containing protein [Marinobacter sp. M216]
MESRILVLDGNQRASLAAVRSLGSRNLWVAVAESTATSMAGMSRYCKVRATYPDPYESPRLFFEAIVKLVNDLDISFLLPITEATTYVLLRYRDELPQHVTFPFPRSDSVEKLANKNELFKYATIKGVPVPETLFCENAEEGLRKLGQIDHFPIVLKPFKSKILEDGHIVSTRVLIAESAEQARSYLASYNFFSYPFTIQSFIAGTGQGVFALYNHGKPVCYFSHRRIREKPPAGGVSVLSESAPLNDALRLSAEHLLGGVQWHGVAMVEFRVDHNGTGYLMEVNPRFWGSLQLAIDSGIDFPWWLYLVCTEQQMPEVKWRQRRVRWILGDLDRLIIILKSPNKNYSFGQKLIEVLRFFQPGLQTRHEVNRWNDLRPFWFELRQYLRALRR